MGGERLNGMCDVKASRLTRRTTLHHHVSIREGPNLTAIPRRARAEAVPEWRGAMYR